MDTDRELDDYFCSLGEDQRDFIDDVLSYKFAYMYRVPRATTIDFIVRLHRERHADLFVISAMPVERPPPVDEEALLAYFATLPVPEKIRIATVFRWLRASFLVTVTEAWSAATQLHEDMPDFFELHLQMQERKEVPDRRFVPFVGQAHRI